MVLFGVQKKKTDCESPKVANINKGELMILLNRAVCDSKNQNLFKNKKLLDY